MKYLKEFNEKLSNEKLYQHLSSTKYSEFDNNHKALDVTEFDKINIRSIFSELLSSVHIIESMWGSRSGKKIFSLGDYLIAKYEDNWWIVECYDGIFLCDTLEGVIDFHRDYPDEWNS